MPKDEEQEEQEEKEEKETKDGNLPDPNKPIIKNKTDIEPEAFDPLIQDYFEELKKKLGTHYNEDLDKVELRQRITIMKHMARVIPKKSNPFPNPKPKDKEDNSSDLKIVGNDYRKLKNL